MNTTLKGFIFSGNTQRFNLNALAGAYPQGFGGGVGYHPGATGIGGPQGFGGFPQGGYPQGVGGYPQGGYNPQGFTGFNQGFGGRPSGIGPQFVPSGGNGYYGVNNGVGIGGLGAGGLGTGIGNNGVLVGPGGPTGIIGRPQNTIPNRQIGGGNGVLVGPGGPTGIIGRPGGGYGVNLGIGNGFDNTLNGFGGYNQQTPLIGPVGGIGAGGLNHGAYGGGGGVPYNNGGVNINAQFDDYENEDEGHTKNKKVEKKSSN